MCHDDASRFMRIVTRSPTRSYIIPEDLIPLVQDVVNTHPGLTFLKQAPEFHSRYVHTVSAGTRRPGLGLRMEFAKAVFSPPRRLFVEYTIALISRGTGKSPYPNYVEAIS